MKLPSPPPQLLAQALEALVGEVGEWEGRNRNWKPGLWGGQGRAKGSAGFTLPGAAPCSWACTPATYANSWHCQKLPCASCFSHVLMSSS